MDRETLLAMFDDCDLTDITETNYEEQVIDLFRPTEEFKKSDFRAGVSKVVIIPRDLPYVIKIPFYGAYESAEYYSSSSCSYGDEYCTDYGDKFIPFECANADKDNNWDYCFTEALLYHEAEKAKVSRAFAKTKLLGFAQGDYPIYIQQKARTYEATSKDTSLYPKERTHQSTTLCSKEFGCGIFNSIWLTDAFEYFGEKQYKRILQFMTKTGMCDLHNGNIGYIGNRPVFIDYAGWSD